MQTLRPGTQLGAYQILRLIGRGGMGEVYEAFEAKLERRVALKVVAPLNPDEHDAEDLIRRFLQEARTLAQVNHPNIVTIYTIDKIDNVQFIAMEYVEGVSFKELLKKFALSADEAAPLFIQMLEGLKCLHDNKIIHRDLKPHNLLLRSDGQVKLLDFGIAKKLVEAVGERTQTGVIAGTLPYMAPEVRIGVPASPRSDLWSLGAIFYECLVGRPLAKVLQEEHEQKGVTPKGLIWPKDSLSWIPPEMRSIIETMCAERIEHRYASCEDAIEAIKMFQKFRPAVTNDIFASLAKKVRNLTEAKEKAEALNAPPGAVKRALAMSVIQAGKDATTNGRSIILGDTALENALTQVASPSQRHHVRKRRKSRESTQASNIAIAAAGGVALLILWLVVSPKKVVHRTVSSQPQATLPTNPGVPSTPRPLELTEPADQRTLWLEPTRIPTFTWSRQLNPGEYVIQLGSDPRFLKVLIQEPVAGNSFRPGRVLPEGRYVWRLVPKDRLAPTPRPSTFTLAHLSPVEPSMPDADHAFSIPSRSQSLRVDLRWNCKPGAKTYRVQVATNAQFTDAQEHIGTDCVWTVSDLTAGTYHWRVRVEDVPELQSLWSEERIFSVVGNERPTTASSARPSPLTLTQPKLRGTEQTIVLPKKPPTLQWNPVKGARSYQLQLSTSRTFAHLLSEAEVNSTRWEWRGATPGQVYWRVRAVAADGRRSNFSERGSLRILLPGPKLKNEYVTASDGPINLDWTPNPLAAGYLILEGQDKTFSGSEERLVPSPSVALEAGKGTSYVRVAAADRNGDRISTYSNIAVIKRAPAAVSPTPTPNPAPAVESLPKPKPLTPSLGAKAVAPGGRISVVLTWEPGGGAEYYTVEIGSDDQFNPPLERRKSKDTRSVLKQMEVKGRVYWRVKAHKGASSSAWSDVFHFDVK